MARGSEQFSFKRHHTIERTCTDCARPVFVGSKKLAGQNVADVRELPVPFYRCRDCFGLWVRGGGVSQREYYLAYGVGA